MIGNPPWSSAGSGPHAVRLVSTLRTRWLGETRASSTLPAMPRPDGCLLMQPDALLSEVAAPVGLVSRGIRTCTSRLYPRTYTFLACGKSPSWKTSMDADLWTLPTSRIQNRSQCGKKQECVTRRPRLL